MIVSGIDVGGENVRVVIMNNGEIVAKGESPTGIQKAEATEQLYEDVLKQAKLKREDRGYRSIARLRPDITHKQAQAEMIGIAARLADAYPDTNAEVGVTVRSVTDGVFSASDRLESMALLAAVGMVLLIACVNLANLLLAPYFKESIDRCQDCWRRTVATAVTYGIPVPAFGSALAYFDGYRNARLPANLLQAQRDYFGAHTFERVDKPRGEFFHFNWTGRGGETAATPYTA